MRNAKEVARTFGMIIVIANRIMLERRDFAYGQLTDVLDFAMERKSVERRQEGFIAFVLLALQEKLDHAMREQKEKSVTVEKNVLSKLIAMTLWDIVNVTVVTRETVIKNAIVFQVDARGMKIVI